MTLLLPPVPPELFGVQEPRVLSRPGTGVASSSVEALALVGSAGLVLDPWQRMLVELVLSERADGRWECREVAYLVARQNGKGAVLEALALVGLFLLDEVREILFSAHEFKTAKKAYRQIRDRIKDAPHLLAQVERRGSRVVGFRQSNEDTSITLRDGTCLRFMARSSNTGRGFSPQMLVIDEAQECSEETRGALFYTLRAQPNPLVVWCGTAPHPVRNNSEAFRALRDRGRRGGDSSLGWVEWNPVGSDDPTWSIPGGAAFFDAAAEANPGLGFRITSETIEADANAAVTDEAWANLLRECFSVWPDDPADGGGAWLGVPRGSWLAAERVLDGRGMDPVTVALEVSTDFGSAALSVAGPCQHGEAIAVLAVSEPATTDLTGWLAECCGEAQRVSGRPIVVDEGSPADKLAGTLEAAGITFTRAKTADVTTAASDLYLGIVEGRVVHRAGEDQGALAAAAGHVVRRTAGDVWLWDRRTGAVVLPILAASLALWGSRQSIAEPEPDFIVV